jgi:PhzF family phenazine biosynthesis protein
MVKPRRFKQVDVFTKVAFQGNPLAVVLDADGLGDEQMARIARWTNLAETTFVLAPTDPAADYRVRIFSPATEFDFAGHPTLGTAHALLESGLQPRSPGRLVQQCGIGLVTVARDAGGALAFQAPVAALSTLDAAAARLLTETVGPFGLDRAAAPIVARIGIAWLVVRMVSAQACLDVRISADALDALKRQCGIDGIALYGRHAAGGPADYEVRAMLTEHGVLVEDPVTGSANACIAQVIKAQGFPDGAASATGYEVRQGTVLQRDGRVSITFRDGLAWVGGHTVTVIDGDLPGVKAS